MDAVLSSDPVAIVTSKVQVYGWLALVTGAADALPVEKQTQPEPEPVQPPLLKVEFCAVAQAPILVGAESRVTPSAFEETLAATEPM